MSALRDTIGTRLGQRGIIAVLLALAIVFPLLFDPLATQMDVAIFVLAYVMMALGLNIVVGFAGLLDLGYVAFYAIGAYTIGWLASDHFDGVGGDKGIHVLVSDFVSTTTGIHINFFLVLFAAVIIAAVLGALIGLPTLRLRGDYIAIVTLAFGEIIGRIALNGDAITFGDYQLTNGQQAISPVDQPYIPIAGYEFDSAFNLRPYYWCGLVLLCFTLFVNFRLRDSRLGRAWIALREDEVAAASMGVPLVRTKLLAYAAGRRAGRHRRRVPGQLQQRDQLQPVPLLVLDLRAGDGDPRRHGLDLGGDGGRDRLGPDRPLPDPGGLQRPADVVRAGLPAHAAVVRDLRLPARADHGAAPEGLFPERRHKIELTEGVGTDETVFEGRG